MEPCIRVKSIRSSSLFVFLDSRMNFIFFFVFIFSQESITWIYILARILSSSSWCIRCNKNSKAIRESLLQTWLSSFGIGTFRKICRIFCRWNWIVSRKQGNEDGIRKGKKACLWRRTPFYNLERKTNCCWRRKRIWNEVFLSFFLFLFLFEFFF